MHGIHRIGGGVAMKIVEIKLEVLVPDNYRPGPDIFDDMEDRNSHVSLHSFEIVNTIEV